MAVTIPGLSAAASADLTDLIEVSQSGASKKETLEQVLTLFSTEWIGAQDICGINVFVPSSNGAQLTLLPYSNFSWLANNFLQAVQSYVYITIPMPKRWDGGTVTMSLDWTATVTSGNVVWSVDAAIVSGTNSLNVTMGTAINTTTAAPGTANTRKTTITSAITPSGTATAGDNNLLAVRIGRNAGAGSDTMAGNAYLVNWNLAYTADQGNDA